MATQQPPKNVDKGADRDNKTASAKEACPGDVHPKPDLDGKNDSGPDPEVHDRELPPQ